MRRLKACRMAANDFRGKRRYSLRQRPALSRASLFGYRRWHQA